MDIDAIEREAAYIAEGIAASKRRTMRYQPDAKDAVARHLGIDTHELDIPAVEWFVIRRQHAGTGSGDTYKAGCCLS
jgi:hypothetical protein